MAVSVASDKVAIKSILTTDPYLIDYLEFDPKEIYCVPATDKLLGQEKNKQQIFIYNTYPEPTVNPVVWGIVYEIMVSVPWRENGTGDMAIEQIIGLLDGAELSNTSKLELIDLPTTLSSETSLYQVGVRFVNYKSIYTKPKKKPEKEPE